MSDDILSASEKYILELEIQKLSQTAATALERLLLAEKVVEAARKVLEWEKSRVREVNMGGAGPYHFFAKPLNDCTIALNAYDAGKPS